MTGAPRTSWATRNRRGRAASKGAVPVSHRGATSIARVAARQSREAMPGARRSCPMQVFEIIIALLLAGAGLTALSRRIGTPCPAMVALAGAGLALVPGTPTLVLDPELALTLFVAPVLLDAAFDSSARDLR